MPPPNPRPPAMAFALRRPEGEKDAPVDLENERGPPHVAEGDPFGDENNNDIKFKTMTWW